MDGGKENQVYGAGKNLKTISEEDFTSATLPRSMRFRSQSGSRQNTRERYGQQTRGISKPKFETKDYGWVDNIGQPTTNAHGDADGEGGNFVRNSEVYATGTLPRGKKVSFKDFV